MFRDFLLASAHHLLLFGLVAMLSLQTVLLSRPLDAGALRSLVGIDRGYGTTAGLLLLAGVARVIWGAKGADYYLHNPWFHAKLGAFVLAALLSIWPTLSYLGWRRQATRDAAWTLDPARLARVRTIVRIELVLVALIFVLAAGMARHGALGL